MILKGLQEKCDWDSVSAKLTELYPDQADNLPNYYQAWLEMRSLTPVPSSMMITIGERHDEQTGKSTYSVSGIEAATGKGSVVRTLEGFRELPYSLGMTKWVEWLGMKIEPRTLSRYSELEIVAHCLFEMTVYGWSQGDVSDSHDELMGQFESDAPIMTFVVADSVKNPFRRVWGRIASYLKLKFLSRRWRRR
jgi:hypothetical protein